MRIIVITSEKTAVNLLSYENYIFNLLLQIVKQKSFELIYFSDDLKRLPLTENAMIVIKISQKKYLQLFWWHNVQLPAIIKKLKADIVIYLNNFCNSFLKIPQIIVPNNYLDNTTSSLRKIKQNKNRKLLYCVKKANVIIANSIFTKEFLIKNYKASEEKIKIIYPSANPFFQSEQFQNIEKIKEKFAAGENFFLTTYKNSTDDLLVILKAFSAFKKWQKSSMKLVVFIVSDIYKKELAEKLKTYKYRNDVQLIEGFSTTIFIEILSAAYAFINIINNNNLQIIPEAMQRKVPVIAYSTPILDEICGDNILYFKAHDPKIISDEMLRIYKDENLKSFLTKNAFLQSNKFSYNEITQQFWNVIQQTAKNK
ncbi:MAG: glycosyltransferase [Chitinophagaceae bacterium]